MINIITIKWGTKYSSNYPNRVYNECKKFCSFDFNFYCVTDDPVGLDENIIALPMPTHSNLNFYNYISAHLLGLTKLWDRPKLYLFKDFNDTFKGTNIFLDLDVQVIADLKFLTTLPAEKPWIIDMWWSTAYKTHWDKLWGTRINSSIIVWRDNQCEPITDFVLENFEQLVNKYATIDCVIGYELTDYTNYNNNFFNWLPSNVAIKSKPNEFIDGYLVTLHGRSLGKHTDSVGI